RRRGRVAAGGAVARRQRAGLTRLPRGRLPSHHGRRGIAVLPADGPGTGLTTLSTRRRGTGGRRPPTALRGVATARAAGAECAGVELLVRRRTRIEARRDDCDTHFIAERVVDDRPED